MEIIGRDKISQSGDNSSVKIDNKQMKSQESWHMTWWGVLLLTIVGGIVVGLFLYLTKTN